MIKAIIFDFGGVIVNAKIEKVYEVLAKKLGVSKVKFNKVKDRYIKDAQIGKISTNKLLDNIASELNLNKNKLKKTWEKAYSDIMVIREEHLTPVKNLGMNLILFRDNKQFKNELKNFGVKI